jgi:hypothetical protein
MPFLTLLKISSTDTKCSVTITGIPRYITFGFIVELKS